MPDTTETILLDRPFPDVYDRIVKRQATRLRNAQHRPYAYGAVLESETRDQGNHLESCKSVIVSIGLKSMGYLAIALLPESSDADSTRGEEIEKLSFTMQRFIEESDWQIANLRRIELIDKYLVGSLTVEESDELDSLQLTADAMSSRESKLRSRLLDSMEKRLGLVG